MTKNSSSLRQLLNNQWTVYTSGFQPVWGTSAVAKGAVVNVRHAIFDQCWPTPSPATLCHTSRTLRIFGSTKNWTQSHCTKSLSMVRGVSVGGFCLGFFVWKVWSGVGFCPFPLLSEYVCYYGKLNITLNFRFHMYDNKFESVTSQALGLPCHKLSHFLWPTFPSSVTYFIDGP